MDVRYINPFLSGTLEVLQKFSNVKATPKKPYLKKTDVAFGDVSGIIGLTGDIVGSLAISFQEDCILGILTAMFGEIHMEVGHETYDAVGEITNMISGNARSKLEKEGLTVFAAIPAVVTGARHSINHILKMPSIVIPFSTEHGDLVVDVCLKKTDQEDRKKENYRVLNQTTDKLISRPRGAAPPPAAAVPRPTPAVNRPPENGPAEGASKKTVPKFDENDYRGKIEYTKESLSKTIALREERSHLLSSDPFMDRPTRQRLQKEVSFLDQKIKNMKLSITALEALIRSGEADEGNVEIPSHYQNYDKKNS
jgi:chemotaxis protein CheX